MEVNDALIDQLANLARLEFDPQEKANIRKDLEEMITMVEKLGELDTSNVKPLLHLTEEVNMLREDVVVSNISREQALSNAPSANNEYFQVPKVIKK